MRKEIIRIIIDLILVFCFVACSIPIWNTYASRLPNIAGYMDAAGLSINYKENTNNKMFVVKGPEDKSDPVEFIIHNSANQTRKGNLILKYEKTSTLDYQYLNIDLNGETYNITSFLMSQDEEQYYFILDEVILDEYQTDSYSILLWLDRGLPSKIYKTEFSYNLEIAQM